VVLRWPKGWEIEQAIGWIAEADEPAVLAKLSELDGPPKSVGDLARVLDGKKANTPVYEIVADAIADTPACAARANDLLSAIALACAGKVTPRFVGDSSTGVLTFAP
jgi:hypothetical protein